MLGAKKMRSFLGENGVTKPQEFELVEIGPVGLGELYSSKRRNHAIVCLALSGNHPMLTLDDLASQVAEQEAIRESDDTEPTPTPSEHAVQMVRRSLLQNHIPKLEEFQIVDTEVVEHEGEEYTVIEGHTNFQATYEGLEALQARGTVPL